MLSNNGVYVEVFMVFFLVMCGMILSERAALGYNGGAFECLFERFEYG